MNQVKIESSEISNIIKSSFLQVYNNRKDLNNSQRSSRFITVLSDRICDKWYPKKTPKLQRTNEDGKNEPGEWLFDMCITDEIELIDSSYPSSRSDINVKILFVLECEFSTSLKEFGKDFGKLLCSNADKVLFIQGLNQEEKYVRDFINRRNRIIEKNFANLGINFFIAYVPSPGKKVDKSYWDRLLNPVDLIEVYLFNSINGKLLS